MCLDSVPSLLQKAIIARFEQAGLREDIKDILVEFQAAGANSLDYHIYLILDGCAAKSFYKAQRLVQHACVEACNREDWVIPFTQIAVHSSNVVDEPEWVKGDSMSAAGGMMRESSPNPR